MRRTIFISHCCCDRDHQITDTLKLGIEQYGWNIAIDPFDWGDITCVKIQEKIKESTHFILLTTPNSVNSNWVRIEALFAQLCHNKNSIIYLPISVDGTPMLEPAKEIIYVKWRSSGEIQELADNLSKTISETFPPNRLAIDLPLSEEIKETGRNYERNHAASDNILFLHEAVKMYEKAIELNFCNHNAWANLAWSLWKLNEDNRAWKYIRTAKEISPYSNHVKDVEGRMERGERAII